VIFDQYKAVLIAVPRTGTHCIFDILHDIAPGSKGIDEGVYRDKPPHLIPYYKHGHFTYRDWKGFLLGGQTTQAARRNYITYKIFSFVRNPYDRMASIFYHYKDHCDSKQTFTEFCHQNLTDEGFWNSWKTQTDFLQGLGGEINLDFIGKLENFESDWSQLQLQFGFPPYDPKYRESNKSKRKTIDNFEELYDEETKSSVFEHFKDDFVNFDYAQ